MSNSPPGGDKVTRTELRLPDEIYGWLLDEVTAKKKKGEKGASLNNEILERLYKSFGKEKPSE